MDLTGSHESKGVTRHERTVHNADVTDNSPISVEIGIEDESTQRRSRFSAGSRDLSNQSLQELIDTQSFFGRQTSDVVGRAAQYARELIRHPVSVSRGEVDLVHRGDHLEAGVDGEICVSKRLCLDPLGGIGEQQRSLAGSERPADLVGEVDVTRGIDQVEDIALTVLRLILDPDRLGLDRDTALPLEIHRVQDLVFHLPLGDRPGALEQTIGQGRLAMVDMGDDREVADMLELVGGGVLGHRMTSA